jgi:hypothetical protein
MNGTAESAWRKSIFILVFKGERSDECQLELFATQSAGMTNVIAVGGWYHSDVVRADGSLCSS